MVRPWSIRPHFAYKTIYLIGHFTEVHQCTSDLRIGPVLVDPAHLILIAHLYQILFLLCMFFNRNTEYSRPNINAMTFLYMVHHFQ